MPEHARYTRILSQDISELTNLVFKNFFKDQTAGTPPSLSENALFLQEVKPGLPKV